MAVTGRWWPCGGGCKFGGLGFAGVVVPWSWFFYKSQPTKPEAPLGIKFPELEFWFGVLRAPGRMGSRFETTAQHLRSMIAVGNQSEKYDLYHSIPGLWVFVPVVAILHAMVGEKAHLRHIE